MTEPTPPEAEQPYAGPVIAIPVYAGVSELELSLMLSLARVCATKSGGSADAVKTVNRSRASIVTAGGLVTTPHVLYAALPEPAALFLPGGPGAAKAARDPLLKTFLQTHRDLPTAVSGSGLLLAGESGLLKNRVVGSPPELVDTVWGYEPADVRAGEVVQDGTLWSTPSGLPALHAAFAVASMLWGAETARAAMLRLGVDEAGFEVATWLPTPPAPYPEGRGS
ncbi:transcriptional regulator [Deinococcus fonticola]|uniref:transcriptional regulator n=1 Tax=Deinococcus fonticola TaxID=2528713 RepID=UPI001F0E9404|nr:transcriptional regulator [Deinococcus fonticola]